MTREEREDAAWQAIEDLQSAAQSGNWHKARMLLDTVRLRVRLAAEAQDAQAVALQCKNT